MKFGRDFRNLILVSEYKAQIDAHKVILASAYSVFRDIFKSVDHITPLMYMRNVKASQLNSMFELIYFGETKVNQDEG